MAGQARAAFAHCAHVRCLSTARRCCPGSTRRHARCGATDHSETGPFAVAVVGFRVAGTGAGRCRDLRARLADGSFRVAGIVLCGARLASFACLAAPARGFRPDDSRLGARGRGQSAGETYCSGEHGDGLADHGGVRADLGMDDWQRLYGAGGGLALASARAFDSLND